MMVMYRRTVKQKVARRKVEGASNLSKLGLTSECGGETRLSTCAYTLAYHLHITHQITPTVRLSTIMSETMFAQALMSGLEKRPTRLSSDHVSDARKYPAQAPVRIDYYQTSTLQSLIYLV
jgi:hypothetical protein